MKICSLARSMTENDSRVRQAIGIGRWSIASASSSEERRSPVSIPLVCSASAVPPSALIVRAALRPPPPGSIRSASQRSFASGTSLATEVLTSRAGLTVTVTIAMARSYPLTSRNGNLCR